MWNSTSGKPLHILMIGSFDAMVSVARAGGTTISLRYLVDELRERRDVQVEVVDLGCSREKSGLLKDMRRGVTFLLGAIRPIWRAEVVSLHAVSSRLWFTGLLTMALARVFRRPVLIRKFAATDYRTFSSWKRWLTRWVLMHCDMYLAETKGLVALANDEGVRDCRWFPTNRPLAAPSEEAAPRTGCRRFIYVGQVREYKGLAELVEACQGLDPSLSVDVYGPLFNDLPADLFENKRGIRYCGTLDPRDVVPTMRRYDALVMPTKARSEGYPGVILEAYAAGLPVIASACGAIPEVVDEHSGVLVEAGDVPALRAAMQALAEDDTRHARMSAHVRERAVFYSVQFWAGKFVTYCKDLAGMRRTSRVMQRG